MFGAKLRLFGDVVADQDVWWPQVALGVHYKQNDRATVLRAIGAKRDNGVDAYVSATKLLLEHSLLVNTTLGMTKANQLGTLGFGGDRNDDYRPQLEASVAYLLSRHFAVGESIG